MNLFARLLSTFALLSLTACGGGGGDSGTSPLVPAPGTGASSVASLVLELSSPSIANTSTTGVTATVTALDSNRNVVKNAAVSLFTKSDAVITLQGTQGSVTDSTGRLQGVVTLGANRANRDITVEASSGSVAAVPAVLKVVDGPTGTAPNSVELIAGATTVGTGGDGVLITAFVKDANNNALAGVPVTFNASNGTLSSISPVTNVAGAATATFSAGANRNNRNVDIKVTSGTISKTLQLPVSGTKMALSGPSSLVRNSTATFNIVVTDSKNNVVPGALVTASSSLSNELTPAVSPALTNSNGQISYTYTAKNAGLDDKLVFTLADSTLPTTVSPSPALTVSDQQFAFASPAASSKVFVNKSQVLTVQLPTATADVVINFAATGGVLSLPTTKTDASGAAQVSIMSSSAGPVTVQATAVLSPTSTASATLPLLIIATTPSKLVLQISPTAIAPNADPVTGTNQAQLVARVTDANGNPVQGQAVNFTRVADPSGGNLLQASSTTDANGQAAVTYRSGAQSTASNGVVLSATTVATVVDGADVPAVSGTAALTVNQNALFIALGTGNVITNLDPQTYQKDWVVYVTDSNGIPVNGATLTIKAIPTHYLTGQLVWDGAAWTYADAPWYCRNEDANTNGVSDATEDDNRDGVLWPGNVIAVTPGNVQTANGRATISLVYAESYAPWVRMRLTASATVAGTESGTSVEFVVVGASSDFSVQTNPPAGRVSPFGLLPKTPIAANACTQTPP